MSDEELISGLKNGDEHCFMELVGQYRKKLISLCYSYTRDYQEAEDLSQEVFLSVYKSIHSFRGDCSLSTFVYRIAVSRCVDHTRKRSIKGFLTGLVALAGQREDNTVERSFIQELIKSLKDEHRLPIILHYHVGLSHNEIAQVLDISPKAVEGRIYRAKQILKSKMEEGGNEQWSTQGII